jgi:hypothetical protein
VDEFSPTPTPILVGATCDGLVGNLIEGPYNENWKGRKITFTEKFND